MDVPLTKAQLCWVLIRLVGVYLLVQTIVALGALVSAALALAAIFGSTTAGSTASLWSSASQGGGTAGLLLSPIISFLLQGALGLYLLFRGSTVHRLMMATSAPWDFGATPRRPKMKPVDPDDVVDPATTLSRRETREFATWLETHPEHGARSQTDQIALFRDAQADRGKQ